MTYTKDDVERVAHAVCRLIEPDDEPCAQCPLRDPGPRGGVRGCIYDAEKVARAALAAMPDGRDVATGWNFDMSVAPRDQPIQALMEVNLVWRIRWPALLQSEGWRRIDNDNGHLIAWKNLPVPSSQGSGK